MPRSIKFRLWDAELRKWVHAPQWHLFELYDAAPGYVLLQFTGMTDAQGQEIYEGDIITFAGHMTADNSMGLAPNGYIFEDEDRHEVIWNLEQACWDVSHLADEEWKYQRDCHGLLLQGQCAVIGNVYEHPERLYPPPEAQP